MIRISADQIKSKLGSPYYLILGSDPYLQNYAQSQIEAALKQVGFDEKLAFIIDNNTDWAAIYDSCQSLNLFSSNNLIILDFAEGGLNASVVTKLNTLAERLTPEIALIIKLHKISKTQENAVWFKTLSDKLIIVNCTTPDINQLPQWINHYLQQRQIKIEAKAIELLCYYYEGNLLALTQLIEQLALLYPNHHITYDQIEENINDSAIFTPYHWIDAIISHKSKRAMHILAQLKINEFEPLILLRIIQRELLLLIHLTKASQKTTLKQAFDEYKIWQSRRTMYTNFLARSDINSLYHALAKLAEMEIGLKHDYSFAIWDALAVFTLDLMGVNSC